MPVSAGVVPPALLPHGDGDACGVGGCPSKVSWEALRRGEQRPDGTGDSAVQVPRGDGSAALLIRPAPRGDGRSAHALDPVARAAPSSGRMGARRLPARSHRIFIKRAGSVTTVAAHAAASSRAVHLGRVEMALAGSPYPPARASMA